MAKKRSRKKHRGAGTDSSSTQKKRGLLIYVPALCSVIGTLMLLSVILAAAPLTIPQYMGYEIYNVVSGSMEPAIPIGSVIYVKPTEPSELKKGDIIAFQSGDSVVMHRIVMNNITDGSFVTKGDANDGEDLSEVPYSNLIGIVARHVPVLGQLLILFGSSFGRICMICFAACGALLNILSGRFSDAIAYDRELEERREKFLAEAMAREEEEKAVAEDQPNPEPAENSHLEVLAEAAEESDKAAADSTGSGENNQPAPEDNTQQQ